jgi:hypothetical protein
MARPVTLFMGQWADLPFETICAKAKSFGYDEKLGTGKNNHLLSPPMEIGSAWGGLRCIAGSLE